MVNTVIQIVVFTVGAFVALGLLVSYFKYEQLHEAAAGDGSGPVPPREVFLLRVAGRLGLGRKEAPFAVAVVEADGAPAEMLEPFLAARVRHSDDLRFLGDGRLALALDLDPAHVTGVVERLRAAWADVHADAPLRFGVAVFPRDGDAAAGLLAAAEQRRALDTSVTEIAPAAPVADPAHGDLVDPLTGVLRAEDVSLSMHKYVARCRREGRPVSLFYADVHDLAGLNERHGRAAGDAVLKTLAQILQRWLREEDLIGRLGDDDFLVALACPPAAAGLAAERILERVRDADVRFEGRGIHFTVNIGIAGHPEHGGTTRVLFDAAESALAAARRIGRHAWAVYEPVRAARALRPIDHSRDRL